jgi:dihydropteroate synthase
MQLFGVINASPDSLNADSIATSADSAKRRADSLIADGCFGFDLGGQGSTGIASEITDDEEWNRLEPLIPTLLEFSIPISVDTWRPKVAKQALQAGVTWLNAADGLQNPDMIRVVAELQCPVVLPFLNGPDPLKLRHIGNFDPVQLIIDFFEDRLRELARYGIRDRVVLDPGTGFAPHDWAWEDRFHYQKEVYSRLGELRRFDLPLYIALPWRTTPQHAELLDIVVSQEPEYGRCHYPTVIRDAESAYRNQRSNLAQ